MHLLLRFVLQAAAPYSNIPLWIALALGGGPLVWDLAVRFVRKEFGSDLLAGISIVTSILLGHYLAGTLVVLMLAGGQSLEAYAVKSASSVLKSLANRLPSVAHRQSGSSVQDIQLQDVQIGDRLLVMPHEICPVDGTVLEGHSVMDESYLTGEPYMISKSPGSQVLSGAINGDAALTIRADKRSVDSRYAKIMRVMESSQQQSPNLRRLGDQLGALYTPFAVALGAATWWITGDPVRFLAVLVVATPCPLLIAIPVAIIGSISLAARRAIIIRDPAVLEHVDTCRCMIFDKTGTLTYGRPQLTDMHVRAGLDRRDVLALVASLEQYSKHPLASAVTEAAEQEGIELHVATRMSEPPGAGLSGIVQGRFLQITSRKQLERDLPDEVVHLPERMGGLECVVLIDKRYAATLRFRDTPRSEGVPFVKHLASRHHIDRVVLLSGDRDEEVQYLANLVGIREFYGHQSPEEKLAFVRDVTNQAKTIFVGDGINDAPALTAATVGIAMGQSSDVTTEAADAVIMESSLTKVDEFLHIGRRMRRIALQSAIGGMALSIVGMAFAAWGYLPPVAGAVMQEGIDVIAVVNALRVAWPPRTLIDF